MKNFFLFFLLFLPLIAQEEPNLDSEGLVQEEPSEVSKAQKIQKRSYYPDQSLQAMQTLSKNENGQYIEHGLQVEFYPDARLKSRGFVIQGKKNGKWIFVSENGQITQGSFQDGLKSGSWKTWSRDKQLLVKEEFLNEALHGPRYTYFEKGKAASEAFYAFGNKQGKEVLYHLNGQKAKEVFFLDDMLHGAFKEWNREGKLLSEGQYYMGIPEGKWLYYNLEGKLENETSMLSGSGEFFEYRYFDTKEESVRYLAKISHYAERQMDGKQIEYFPSGQIKSEQNFSKGKKNGTSRQWYSNSNLRSQAEFKNDSPVGTAKEFYPSDESEEKIAKEILYGDGIENAMVTEYSPEGKKLSIMYLKEGVPDGDFKAFYQDETPMRSGQFINGLKSGLWKEYYANGSLQSEQEFLIDKANGKYVLYFERVQEEDQQGESPKEASEEEEQPKIKVRGFFVNGEKDGQWRTYYPNESLESSFEYRYGVEDGKYQEWWPKNGSQESLLRVEGAFVLGRKDGTWKIWHANGLIKSEGNFVHGQQEGMAQEWYDYLIDRKPVLKMKGSFKNGKQEGLWESYFSDGRRELSQSYKDGKLKGVFEHYYPTGVLKTKTFFVEGKRHGQSLEYYPNKKLKNRLEYANDIKHGPYEDFYEHGALRTKGQYRYNLPSAQWRWYDKEGRIVLASSTFEYGKGTMYKFDEVSGKKHMEIDFDAGVQDGRQMRWYDSGVLRSQASYHKGLLHGSFKEYHENSHMMSESTWIYGRKNGSYLSWYGNQQQQLSLYFVDDVPHGDSMEWYENGQIKSEGTWLYGKRNGHWKWFDRYGQEILSQDYDAGILTHSSEDQSGGQ